MLSLVLTLAVAAATDAPAAPPNPIVVVKIVRPDQQLGRFLDLFAGTKWGTPARAYARWKMKSPPGGFGFTKAAEAGFAILNWEMVRELRSLDGVGFMARLTPDDRFDWAASIPGDDGTFDALATAMALTDGARVDEFEGSPVDRLGPLGAPLMMKGKKGGVVLAGSREILSELRGGIRLEPKLLPGTDSGLIARLDAVALDRAKPVLAKQVAAGLLGAGLPALESSSALQKESWRLILAGNCDQSPVFGPSRIRPEWLAPIPDEDVEAAFSLAIDPTPAFWNAVFGWIDRVERADPSRAGVAPSRLRLALITTGLGIRPEVDLFPHLVGATGYALAAVDPNDRRAVLTLHFKDPKAANGFVEKILKPLGKTLKAGDPRPDGEGNLLWSDIPGVGDVEVAVFETEVRVGRGRGSLKTLKKDGAGVIGKLARWDGAPVQRFAYVNSRLLVPSFPPSSRLIWTGRSDGTVTRDELVVTGVRDLAAKVLEQLLPEGENPRK